MNAITAFLHEKSAIDHALARLVEISNDHFCVNPESITWGDVADISRISDMLNEITDIVFKEGEHA